MIGQLSLPLSIRCQFAPFGLQCVYVAHDDYCLGHHRGLYWRHLSLKDYERQERYPEGSA